MKKALCLFGILFLYLGITAQVPEVLNRVNQFYVTWGYNRAYYNRSDIHFKGEGFDFVLKDARAEDMPESFRTDVYFNPTQFTVPQFNFRLGYYFKNNTAVSLGWDHMKYHLVPTQMVKIDGFIDPEKFDLPEYTGVFNNEMILYKGSFMDYHHSDGFNFIRLAIEKRMPFWNSYSQRQIIAMNGSVSVGAIMPWTDFTFFGEHYRNKPHFAGYGASLCIAFRYEFLKYFFLQIGAQAGWSNLKDILLQDHLDSRASQKITFVERSWALGGYFPIKKRVEPISDFD